MNTDENPSDSAEEILTAAEEALDSGQPGEALELLGPLVDSPQESDVRENDAGKNDPDDVTCARLLAAEALTEIGLLEEARHALALAANQLDADDEGLLARDAQLCLREWRPQSAQGYLEQLLEVGDPEGAPAALWDLALCRDLAGDPAGADRYLQRASALDPESVPIPPRLSPEEFDQFVQQAVSALDDPFRSALDRLEIVAAPMPTSELAHAGDPAEVPPDVLGLFVGPTLEDLASEEGSLDARDVRPIVYLFQRNIERTVREKMELFEEIRVTLYHEIGHFLGHDEEGVEGMGLA